MVSIDPGNRYYSESIRWYYMEEVQPVVMPRSEVVSLLTREFPVIREQYGIVRLGLFGSYARDEAGPHSDIDLLVSFEDGKERFRSFMQCIFYLEDRLGKKIELITEHAVDHRIRSDLEKEVIWI